MSLAFLLTAVLAGSFISWVAVGISVRFAERINFHDHPDGDRKNQVRPIPRLGGVAVAIAFMLTAIVLSLWLKSPSDAAFSLSLLLPALLAAGIGFADDLLNVPPYWRLLLQAIVGALAWIMGSRVGLDSWVLVDFALTVIWFMVVINGINLLDNSDGLASSTVLVAAVGTGLIALFLGQQMVSVLAVALVGVCLGYLRYNWNPARVYMGDSGAYFLGFLLAALILRLDLRSLAEPWGFAVAMLLVVLPLVDMSYVVTSRIRSGIHPFTAGRDHLAHMLQNRGKSVTSSILILQAISIPATCLAVLICANFAASSR